MATAVFPLERFQRKDLPATCALTGLPAADVFAFRFDGVPGALPVNGNAVRSIARRQTIVKSLLVASLGLFLVAAVSRAFPVGVLALLTFIVGTGLGLSLRNRLPQGYIDSEGLHVDNVHEGFVSALSAGAAHACAGCPAASSCSTEQKSTCDGHEHKTLASA